MTNNEALTRNLDLAFSILRQVIEEPNLKGEVDSFAKEGTIALFDDADAEHSAMVEASAARMEARGEPVVRLAVTRSLAFEHR